MFSLFESLERNSSKNASSSYYTQTKLVPKQAGGSRNSGIASNDGPIFRRNTIKSNNITHSACSRFNFPRIPISIESTENYKDAEHQFITSEVKTTMDENFVNCYNSSCRSYKLGDFENALSLFKKAHQLDPAHDKARRNYLSLLYEIKLKSIESNQLSANDLEQTLTEIHNILVNYNDYFDYFLLLKGRILFLQKKYDDALLCFRQVLAKTNIDPKCEKRAWQYYSDTIFSSSDTIFSDNNSPSARF